jgi:hypothetical protein
VRLLDRQLLRTVGVVEKRFPQTLSTMESRSSLHLVLTDIGLAVGENVERLLPLEHYEVDSAGGPGVTLVVTEDKDQ